MTTKVVNMRWKPEEWLFVAAAALPDIDKGMDRIQATLKACRLLPPERHREKFQNNTDAKKILAGYLEKVRAMSRKERDAMEVPTVKNPTVPAPAPVVAAKPARKSPVLTKRRVYVNSKVFQAIAAAFTPSGPAAKRGPFKVPNTDAYQHSPDHILRWTHAERSQLVRAFDMMARAGVGGTAMELLIIAQEFVLPPDRRHWDKALHRLFYKKPLGEFLEEGRARAALIENIPLPQAFLDALDPPAAEPEPEAQETPQEATPVVVATTPAPAPRSSLQQATRGFVDTMAGAFDKLLLAHQAAMVDQLQGRISAMADTMGASIAAVIQQGMRQAVHSMVEAELGAVAAPAADEQVKRLEQVIEQVQQPKPTRLKVDVVGLVGPNISRVRDAFNGSLDARYIDPNEVKKWIPTKDRHVIAFTRFVPHSTNEKLKKAGVSATWLTGGPQLAIQAIENLMEQQGIERKH